jgi:hypothetical protein
MMGGGTAAGGGVALGAEHEDMGRNTPRIRQDGRRASCGLHLDRRQDFWEDGSGAVPTALAPFLVGLVNKEAAGGARRASTQRFV